MQDVLDHLGIQTEGKKRESSINAPTRSHSDLNNWTFYNFLNQSLPELAFFFMLWLVSCPAPSALWFWSSGETWTWSPSQAVLDSKTRLRCPALAPVRDDASWLSDSCRCRCDLKSADVRFSGMLEKSSLGRLKKNVSARGGGRVESHTDAFLRTSCNWRLHICTTNVCSVVTAGDALI